MAAFSSQLLAIVFQAEDESEYEIAGHQIVLPEFFKDRLGR